VAYNRDVIFRILAAVAVSAASMVAQVTFSTKVWPIFEQHCVGCHQKGEIAPMPLTSYAEVRPWAAAIGEDVLSKKMPPWHAEGETKHVFLNDRSLTDEEIETIADWVKTGAREGRPLKRTFQAEAHADGWKLGKPDIVIRVPGFPIPASGQLGYRYLITGDLFPADVWVRAAEWHIDQRSAVHHVNAYVRGPESSYLKGYEKGKVVTATVEDRARRRDGERNFDRREQLVGWEPGYEPMPWLEDGAKLVHAGSDIVFEIHYNPNGKALTDYSELGLYLADGPPVERVLSIDTLRDLDLAIPAGSWETTSRAAMTLAHEVKLVSVQPHMHYRGKAMDVRAVYPDGRSEVLVSVPRYDFNWQTTYALKEPKLLPAGTRLESVAKFDNSTNNKFNPDPKVPVHWGDQTTDEMHIAFLELAIPAADDPEKIFAAAPRMIGK
jgi:Copper type II ascorbate-dependent monooxygenase, C-terminal domain